MNYTLIYLHAIAIVFALSVEYGVVVGQHNENVSIILF